jgi:hypothetical protein
LGKQQEEKVVLATLPRIQSDTALRENVRELVLNAVDPRSGPRVARAARACGDWRRDDRSQLECGTLSGLALMSRVSTPSFSCSMRIENGPRICNSRPSQSGHRCSRVNGVPPQKMHPPGTGAL